MTFTHARRWRRRRSHKMLIRRGNANWQSQDNRGGLKEARKAKKRRETGGKAKKQNCNTTLLIVRTLSLARLHNYPGPKWDTHPQNSDYLHISLRHVQVLSKLTEPSSPRMTNTNTTKPLQENCASSWHFFRPIDQQAPTIKLTTHCRFQFSPKKST